MKFLVRVGPGENADHFIDYGASGVGQGQMRSRDGIEGACEDSSLH